VKQCERARRAYPVGEISFNLQFGGNQLSQEVKTTDDEQMALFVVLMRPFLDENSQLFLPRLWRELHGSGLVVFSESDAAAFAHKLEQVKIGSIGYQKNDRAIRRDEFYRILADGTYFGDIEVAAAKIQAFRRDALHGLAWLQFLTFNVDSFPLVAFLARRIKVARRLPHYRALVATLSPAESRCIYCCSRDGPFRAEEHVYPESLVPEYLAADLPILPVGVVCDPCNNGVLSRLDKAFLNFPQVALVRLGVALFTKKGRMPSVQIGDTTIRKVRPRVLRIERGGRIVDPVDAGHLSFTVGPDDWRLLARAIFKLGLGMVAFKVGVDRAFSPDFDRAREFILRDEPFRNDFYVNTSLPFDPEIRFEFRDDDEMGTPITFSLFGKRFAANLRENPRFAFPGDLAGAEDVIVVALDAPRPPGGPKA